MAAEDWETSTGEEIEPLEELIVFLSSRVTVQMTLIESKSTTARDAPLPLKALVPPMTAVLPMTVGADTQ